MATEPAQPRQAHQHGTIRLESQAQDAAPWVVPAAHYALLLLLAACGGANLPHRAVRAVGRSQVATAGVPCKAGDVRLVLAQVERLRGCIAALLQQAPHLPTEDLQPKHQAANKTMLSVAQR